MTSQILPQRIKSMVGREWLCLSIRSSGEDLLAMTEAVNAYVGKASLPHGYQIVTWADQSIDVRDRLEMLVNTGTQGLLIVFVILSLFLNLKIAFWVALGIPFCMLGAGGLMFLNRPDSQYAVHVCFSDGDWHCGR